jgi:aspartate kinase
MISTSEVKVSCVIGLDDGDRAIAELCKTFDISSSSRPIASSPPSSPTANGPDAPAVRGVALDRNQAQLAIRAVPDRPGMAARIFSLLAEHQVSVDMIIQSQRCRIVNGVSCRDIACTVARADADSARQVLEEAQAELGYGEIEVIDAIAKVSVVGAGMVDQPGVAAKMFKALADHNINIQMIATSEIKISCLVDEEQGVEALTIVHNAFGLAGSQKVMVPA